MARAHEHRRPLGGLLVLLVFAPVLTLAMGRGPGRPEPKQLAPWGHVGEQAHRSQVEGYQISYHLLSYSDHGDLLEQLQAGLPAHSRQGERGTHHLMTFVMDPRGQMVTDARVNYTVRASEGAPQEATARPMSGGYGADLRLVQGHPYRVEAEIRVDGAVLTDGFELTLR